MTRDDQFIGELEGYLDEFDGLTPLPDAVRDAVRVQLSTTSQIGPVSGLMRYLIMNRPLQLALAAAAAVLVAFVGLRLFSNSNIGNSEPIATPDASQPASVVQEAPLGPLVAGTYAAIFDPPLTFTVPAGWSAGVSAGQLELHPTAMENAGTSRQAILVCRDTQAVDAADLPVAGIGTDAASITTYVAARADLRSATTPQAVNIGGLDGWWLDFVGPDEQTHSTSIFVVGPRGCGIDAWPLQITRLGVFDVRGGGNILIVIYTPTGDQGFLAVGTPIVQSFVFEAQ
jgi:hypothetical protein